MARGHRDDGKGIVAGCLDVSRCVAYHADPCVASGQFAGLASRLADQLRAKRKVIAEAAKAEPFAQAGFLDLIQPMASRLPEATPSKAPRRAR